MWRLEGATRQWSAIHQNTQPKHQSQPKRLNNVGRGTLSRPAFPSEGHGARNCLHPDPCSVRSRQSPYHASVRKGGHQIHIFEGGEPHEKVTLGSLFGPLPSKSGSVRKGSHRFTSWRVENSAKNTQPRGRASPGFIKTSRSISDETTHRRTIWTIIRAHPGDVSSEGYVD